MDMKNSELSSNIAITLGDPGGVGPEVIAKSLKRQWKNQFKFNPVVIGSKKVFQSSYIQKILFHLFFFFISSG